MLIDAIYDRNAACLYAQHFAYRRNPKYLDFSKFGGNCTNFVSQCLYAGSGIMNFNTNGWYYRSSYDRSASWTSVISLYRFLVSNTGVGPYAVECGREQIEAGDIVQLRNSKGRYYHSLLITRLTDNEILVAANDLDAFDRALSSYEYAELRYLHIKGVRKF